MGFLKHFPAGLFVFLAMAIGAFAVAVHNNYISEDVYEKHVTKPLESLEFIFTWIGLFYFVLPMISFTIVNDWTKTFYDCFSPMTLWMDAIYSGVIIIYFISFLGDILENLGRIMCEYVGIGLLLSCIYGYVMLKCSNDANFTHRQASIQNMFVLLFLAGFGLATLLQLQFHYIVPDGHTYFPIILTGVGIACQGAQPVLSLIFRFKPEPEFNDDDRGTRNTKVCAAVVRVITLTYDVWSCNAKGYWNSRNKAPFAVLICVCLGVSWVQLVYRYLGPRKIKDILDAWDKDFAEKVRQRCLSTSADVQMKTFNRSGVLMTRV